MTKQKNKLNSSEKSKTTVLIDKTVKKLAQVYAIQHETTLQAVIETALKSMLAK